MSSNKPRLNRKVLEQHGVVYSEDIYPPLVRDGACNDENASRLPDHVESLREALLDFHTAIPETMRPFFEDECQTLLVGTADENIACDNLLPPASAYLPVPTYETRGTAKDNEVAEREIEENHELAKRSREYTVANASESTWGHFLHSNVFKNFEDTNPSRENHDHSLDAWYLESNLHWNVAKTFRNFDPSITQPTGPKPDLTYGIPISGPCDVLPRGFRGHELVQNFSIEVLGDLLQSKGLVSSPVSGMSEWTKKKDHKLSQSHLVCFPWAVVELKPVKEEENPIQFCYCQAANGASAALTLLENLYRRASLATVDCVERVPPVIAFTCIGPEIRVWLGFTEVRKSKSVAHRIVCIWASTLNATWGVMATRQIVKHMVFWASRFLRPQISSCISQIRFPAPSPYPHSCHISQDGGLTPPLSGDVAETRTYSPTSAGLATPSRDPRVSIGLDRTDSLEQTSPSPSENSNSSNTDEHESLFPAQEGGHRQVVDRATSRTPPPDFSNSIFIESQEPHATQDTIRVKLPMVDHEKPGGKKTGNRFGGNRRPSAEVIVPVDVGDKSVFSSLFSNPEKEVRKSLVDRNKPGSSRKVLSTGKPHSNFSNPKASSQSNACFTFGDNRFGMSSTNNAYVTPALKISLGHRKPSSQSITPFTFSINRFGTKAPHNPFDTSGLHISLDRPKPSYQLNTFFTVGIDSAMKSLLSNGDNQQKSSEENLPSSTHATKTSSSDSDSNDKKYKNPFLMPTLAPESLFSRYSIYRTAGSFSASGYHAGAWWDSHDDDDDNSYQPSSDDADDEDSSCDSHSTHDEEGHNQCWGAGVSSPLIGGSDAVLTQGVIDGLLSQAVKCLSGTEFVELNEIRSLLNGLTGTALLKATWQALEAWEEQDNHWRQSEILDSALDQLHTALMKQNIVVIEKFYWQHLVRGERWQDLSDALQAVQIVSESSLRDVLTEALRCWDGEKCLEILSAEIEELTTDEIKSMQKKALFIHQSTSDILTDSYVDS